MAAFDNNVYAVTAHLSDISTAGQTYVVAPFAGEIVKAYSVINGAIATADAVLTLKIGGTAVTGGTITIANASSAAGDVDSCAPTAARSVTDGQAIEIETDGGSTNTVSAEITILIRR